MKKLLLLTVLAGAISLQAMAQDDDMYFVPDKTTKSVDVGSTDNKPAYYRGTNRSVDEYNRAGRFRSYYQKIGTDSLGNDIVTFRNVDGVAPDRVYLDTAYVYPGSAMFDDDFEYSQRMSRWDDFYDPWLYGYAPWRFGWYGRYYNPWYAGYGGWYDPWYAGWYGGWYDPWYYGYAGWYSPWYWYGYGYPGYWYGGGYVTIDGGNPRGLAGNRTWSFNNDAIGSTGGRFGRGAYTGGSTSRNTYTSRSASNRSFGGRTNSSRTNSSYSRTNQRFGNNTRSSSSFGTSSFGSSAPSGGSFGGGRSAGGGFGGSRPSGGGGGHFGGGRR